MVELSPSCTVDPFNNVVENAEITLHSIYMSEHDTLLLPSSFWGVALSIVTPHAQVYGLRLLRSKTHALGRGNGVHVRLETLPLSASDRKEEKAHRNSSHDDEDATSDTEPDTPVKLTRPTSTWLFQNRPP